MEKITAAAVREGGLEGHRTRLAARTPPAGRWRCGGGASAPRRRGGNRRRVASDQLVQGHVAREQVGEAAERLHLQERQLVIGQWRRLLRVLAPPWL